MATAQSRRVSWSTLFYGLAAFGSAAGRGAVFALIGEVEPLAWVCGVALLMAGLIVSVWQFIEGLLNETDLF